MTKTLALYHADPDYANDLQVKFRHALPDHHVVIWQDNVVADYLITWKPDDKIFATKGVQIVFGLGAGVDAFLTADVADNIPIVRLEEAGMGKQMLEIVLYGILHHTRDMIALNRGQRSQTWLGESTPKTLPFSAKIGVMGLGQLGGFVAEALAQLGYHVSGYSRRLKDLPHVDCYDDCGFDDFLRHSDILINLLPLTPQTEDILNADLFAKLPRGTYLINIARGRHLVETDLIPALNSGQLSGALLDVFRTEPLPQNHDFWCDDRILITPHLAAITLQDDAVEQISRNILSFEKGEALTGIVNRQKGY